jgi:hypothetical protein
MKISHYFPCYYTLLYTHTDYKSSKKYKEFVKNKSSLEKPMLRYLSNMKNEDKKMHRA